jgi:glycosyltransferase involved in cell wall biosynthesis
MPDVLVTDARAIEEYYRAAYGQDSLYIPYGSDLSAPTGTAALARLGLVPDGYLLYVSRFEPENNPDAVVRGYRGVPGTMPLVLIGGAPYADAFITSVKAEAAGDPRVLLPGPVYGEGYRELLAHAALYVHATEVGGTHPALLEAMGFGRPLVVHDTPENRETAGPSAVYVDAARPETLTRAITDLLADPERRRTLGRAARRRATALYRWDAVTDAYEKAFLGT